MTVRAEQHALSNLAAHCVERARNAEGRERKGLCLRVHVVKVKSSEISVIAAHRAATTRLLDQRCFCPSAMRRDPLGPAGHAAVVAAPFQDELDSTVLRTVSDEVPFASDQSAPAALGSEAVLAKPMADGRLTAIHALRDLSRRQTFVDERGQQLAIDASTWRCHAVMVERDADRKTNACSFMTRSLHEAATKTESCRRPPARSRSDARRRVSRTSGYVGLNPRMRPLTEVSTRDPAHSRAPQPSELSAVPLSFSPPSEYFSFASVFDSIWRTRSRVTPTSEPMSSSVIGASPASP